MKKILLLIIVMFLVSSVVYADYVVQYNESFEGVGIPADWVKLVDNVDWDNEAYAKSGTKSLRMAAGTANLERVLIKNWTTSNTSWYVEYYMLTTASEKSGYGFMGSREGNAVYTQVGLNNGLKKELRIVALADNTQDYVVNNWYKFRTYFYPINKTVMIETYTVNDVLEYSISANFARSGYDEMAFGSFYTGDNPLWVDNVVVAVEGVTATDVTLISPTDTLITNADQNFTFNFTGFTAEYCVLYDNRTGVFDANITLVAPTGNTTLATNITGLNDGSYLWNVMCNDTTTEYWGSTTNYSLVIDSTIPGIILNTDNAFNSENYSLENQYDDNMTLNITFTDERDLYAMSINITKDGTIYFNITNESLSGENFNYYKILNTSTWGEGVFDIEVIRSDSHTDNLINNYAITKSNKNLEFDTEEGNNIKIYSEENAVTNAIKRTDRYEFEFKFDNKIVKDRTFHIESDYKINYRVDSGYKAHFVVWNGRNGNWIDFEGIYGTPRINKINDYHYTVTFKNLASYVKFNSIGGLNIVTENYLWYKGVYNLVAPTGSAGESVLFSLNITTNNTISILDADLFYNGVLQINNTKTNYTKFITFNKTISSGDPGNVNYYWNITTIQGDGSISRFNLSGVHSVSSWNLTNCSAGNITLTINIFDEESPSTDLEANVEINMEYWISSKSNSQNFSVEMNGSSKYSICLERVDSTIYTDTYIKYTTVNGFTHRYYLVNQSLTNTTLNISMYNFDTTTDISDLRITTRYFDYTYFPNIIGKLQRRYVAEDVWRTVQMDESGSYGLIFYNIKEEDTDYRIIFQDRNNHVLKTTENMKFSCTSGLCEIVFLLDPYAAGAVSPGITYNYEYDNSTGIITLNWDDPLGLTSTVRLLVVKETMAGSLVICDEEKSGATGTTTCDVGAYTGMLLLKVYSSASPEESLFTDWIDVRRQFLGNLINTEYGSTEGVIWTFGVLVTIVMTGLISPVFAIISMIFGLIVIFFFGIFTPLTMTFLIISVILGIIIGIKVRK